MQFFSEKKIYDFMKMRYGALIVCAALLLGTAYLLFAKGLNYGIDFSGGTLVQVVYSRSGMMNLNTGLICDKELTIKSVFRYRHIYPLAIKAVAEGRINLKGIVTNRFELDDIQNAMDSCAHDKVNIVKAVIRM